MPLSSPLWVPRVTGIFGCKAAACNRHGDGLVCSARCRAPGSRRPRLLQQAVVLGPVLARVHQDPACCGCLVQGGLRLPEVQGRLGGPGDGHHRPSVHKDCTPDARHECVGVAPVGVLVCLGCRLPTCIHFSLAGTSPNPRLQYRRLTSCSVVRTPCGPCSASSTGCVSPSRCAHCCCRGVVRCCGAVVVEWVGCKGSGWDCQNTVLGGWQRDPSSHDSTAIIVPTATHGTLPISLSISPRLSEPQKSSRLFIFELCLGCTAAAGVSLFVVVAPPPPTHPASPHPLFFRSHAPPPYFPCPPPAPCTTPSL